VLKLNLGCGPNVFPGWINIDRADMSGYLLFLASQNTDMGKMPPEQRTLAERLRKDGIQAFPRQVADIRKGLMYSSGSVDLIYLGQVIEHLNPVYEAPQLLRECWRVLVPKGILRISTPDLELLLNSYHAGGMDQFAGEQPEPYAKTKNQARKLAYIMYGSMGPASTSEHYEGHQMIYTFDSLAEMLREAGFEEIVRSDAGASWSEVIKQECVDTGVSHSVFVEAVK